MMFICAVCISRYEAVPIIVVGLVLAVPIIVVGLVLIVLPVAPARANEFAPTGSYKHLLQQALFEGFGLLNLLGDGFDFLIDGG